MCLSDEEEWENAEVNKLKSKGRRTSGPPNKLMCVASSYGSVEGGILKSEERWKIKSLTPKKTVKFNLEEGGSGSGEESVGVCAVDAEDGGRDWVKENEDGFQELDDSYFEVESMKRGDGWVELDDEELGDGSEGNGSDDEEDEEEGKEEIVMEEDGVAVTTRQAPISEEEADPRTGATVGVNQRYVLPHARAKSQKLTKKVQGLMNR